LLQKRQKVLEIVALWMRVSPMKVQKILIRGSDGLISFKKAAGGFDTFVKNI
jgi:hypothetical protein